MKKAVSLVLVLILSLSMMNISAFAASVSSLSFYLNNGIATVASCDKDAVGKVTIPANVIINNVQYEVKHIGDKAFSECENVTVIAIPEGVTTIGSHAFYDCESLREVYVPSSLLICQYDAFEGCSDVVVHCYKSNYQFFTVYGFSNNITVNILDDSNIGAGGTDNTNSGGITVSDIISGSIIETIMKFIQQILAMVGIHWDWNASLK